MRAAYTGHEVLTFMDYLDGETGRTLTAEPGGTYDVIPAGGRNVPGLPPGFTAVVAVEEEAEAENAEVSQEPEETAAEGSAEL
jgi:hypothetical protein